jgi:GT2 family glycosyltransferase
MPKFSVVISAHDHYAEKLRGCLESIDACEDRGIETILVLSGPVLASFKEMTRKHSCTTVYSKKTLPPSKARNAGARKARGEWLVFLDSDCIIPKDYFSMLRMSVERKGAPDCIVGGVVSADRTRLGCFEEFEHNQSLKKYLYFRGGRKFSKVCVGANMAISRKVFNLVGGFDPKLDSAEDREFGARLFLNGYNIEYLEGLTVKHKYHTSISRTVKRHMWHAKGNRALYARYPQVFSNPLTNRLSLIADSFAMKGKNRTYYLLCSLAVGIPYMIKFSLMRFEK